MAVTNLKDLSTGYFSLRNGGGDSIQTDGDLPVLELAAVVANQQTIAERAGVILSATAHEYVIPTEEHDTVLQQLWNRRPPQNIVCYFVYGLGYSDCPDGRLV